MSVTNQHSSKLYPRLYNCIKCNFYISMMSRSTGLHILVLSCARPEICPKIGPQVDQDSGPACEQGYLKIKWCNSLIELDKTRSLWLYSKHCSMQWFMGTMHIKKKTTHGYTILEFERFIEFLVYRNLPRFRQTLLRVPGGPACCLDTFAIFSYY